MRTNRNGGNNYIVVFIMGFCLVVPFFNNKVILVGFNYLPPPLLPSEYVSVNSTFWRFTYTVEIQLGAA